MTRFHRCLFTAAALFLGPAAVLAQFPSEVVSFEDSPADDPAAKEVFRNPQTSGSTSGIVLNVSGEDNNGAFRTVSGFGASEGSQAYQVFWSWTVAANPDAWVRLTTFDTTSRPNPSLDTRGKVRMQLQNVGSFVNGAFGLCIGIRETGVDAAQLENGGTIGAIEWVGVDPDPNAIIEPEAGGNGTADTTASGDDVQLIPPGNAATPGASVIGPGANGAIDTTPADDDAFRIGYFRSATGTRVPAPAVIIPVAGGYRPFEVDLATGDVTYDGVTTDGAIISFANGNGVLDPPNFRGTLEHLALTNVTTDTATSMLFLIDELQVEATVADPVDPPTVIAPVFESATQVQVQAEVGAVEAELFLNNVSQGTEVPDGGTGIATFTGLSLVIGDELRATQTVGAVTSPQSAIVTVVADGTALAENFDGYVTQADLNQFWTNSINNPTPASARLTLSSGSAASCDNLITENNPSGADAARLYRSFGSLNGSDAEPLLVTWKFKHDVQNSNARTRLELARFASGNFSTATGDPGTCGIGMINEFAGALITNYAAIMRFTDFTMPPAGWVSSGARSYAPTAVARTAAVWHTMQIEVKSAVINYYIDGVLANPTGYEAGVPRPNAEPYQFVIVGQGFSNNGPRLFFDDISVTIGAAPLPFGPANPIDSPSIVAPLYPGVTTVSLTGVADTSDRVTIYANDRSTILGQLDGPFTGGVADVAVPALNNGEVIYATQSVGGPSYICDITALLPETFLGCYGDADGNGTVNPGDRGFVSANIGQSDFDLVCRFDMDGNGTINAGDRGFISANIGFCQPLPNYMNGSGLNAAGDGPDPRFPGAPLEESCLSTGVTVAVPPPTVQAVLVPTQTSVSVSNVVEGVASRVTVYANEFTEIGHVDDPVTDPVVVTVTPLNNGDTITATQTITDESGPSAAVVVRVPAPVLITQVDDGDTSVQVDGLHALASTVTVYVDGGPTSAPTGGSATVVVIVPAVAEGQIIRATQTIGGVVGPNSNALVVLPVFCLLAFEDDFDTDTSSNWTTLASSPTDTRATFNFDYATAGVPAAPNSGGTTLGLMLEANFVDDVTDVAQGLTLVPTGGNFTGNYVLRFDMWINANGPFSAGGLGSTQYLNAGIGHDSATNNFHGAAITGSGGWFAVDGEGGSTRDYRAYKNAGEQFAESGQFAAGTSSAGGGAHNNSHAYYTAAFPAVAPPAAQTALFAAQTGSIAAGSAGFVWRQVEIRRTGDLVRWAIDGLEIAELNNAIGATFSLEGNIALGYMDPFASVSDNPAMSFGLIDNVRVFLEAAQCDTGACCTGGVCSDTDEASCTGTFSGLGTECATTVCP